MFSLARNRVLSKWFTQKLINVVFTVNSGLYFLLLVLPSFCLSASTNLFDKVAANSADRNNASLQNYSSHLLDFCLTRKTEWWQAVNDILCQW